jgi:hypothetical protein
MSNYYYCECPKCGWKGSSEFLLGGGPIADTGDYDDVYCPVCDNWDVEEIDPPDTETHIPKHLTILHNALLRCEHIFMELAGSSKSTGEEYEFSGNAEDCREAIKLSDRTRLKEKEETK